MSVFFWVPFTQGTTWLEGWWRYLLSEGFITHWQSMLPLLIWNLLKTSQHCSLSMFKIRTQQVWVDFFLLFYISGGKTIPKNTLDKKYKNTLSSTNKEIKCLFHLTLDTMILFVSCNYLMMFLVRLEEFRSFVSTIFPESTHKNLSLIKKKSTSK